MFCPVGRPVGGAAWVQVRGWSPVHGQIQQTRVSLVESRNNMSTFVASMFCFPSTGHSGGFRGGARGARPPSLF